MEILILYLIVIVIILISLTIHELGHFFAAKSFNVNIKQLSIGIGPKLISWHTKNNIIVSLKLFPIMAYVLLDSHAIRQMYNFETDEAKYRYYTDSIPMGKKLLEDTKTWQYLIIMLAGVFLNIVLFLIFWLICYLSFPSMLGGEVYQNPFLQLGDSFKIIGCNMAFIKTENGGSIFGQIIHIVGSNTKINWVPTFLNMFVSLNLMLTIFNLIPMPPLDGYKTISSLFKKTTGKRISMNAEIYISLFTFILMIYIFVSSIIVDFL